jgi:transposase-like protein
MSTSLASRLTWVREYLAGHGSAAEAAAHCQISLSQLRRWYRRYRAEGTAGRQHRYFAAFVAISFSLIRLNQLNVDSP